MATVVRNQFGDLLEEKFREIAFLEHDRYPSLYPECFNIENSNKNNEHTSGVSGLTTPNVKAEGSDMVYDSPEQLWDKTFTNVTYAQGVRITMEAMDDDQYGILGERMFSSMGRGFREKKETVAYNVFNNGFTTELAQDGVAVFSTSHTRNPNDATTHANRPSTDADLSVSSLKAAITNFRDTLDHRGLHQWIEPRTLVVPTGLEFTAQEILQSALEPYVAENTKNVLAGYNLKIHQSPYLSDADAWFLMSDKADHGFCFFNRKSFTVKRDTDFDSWDAKFGGVERYTVGVKDWRGSYGTTGA